MAFRQSMLSFFVVLLQFWSVFGQDKCLPPSTTDLTCVCDPGDGGGTIDLTPLANTDKTPRFPSIARVNDYFAYSYNPCYGYLQGASTTACGGDLGEVSSCQFNTDNGDAFSLGDPKTEAIYINKDSGLTYVQYTNGQDGRITKVYLVCDLTAESPTITADSDEQEQLTYVYHLTTKCACQGGCAYVGPPTSSRGGSVSVAPGTIGIVLIVLLFPAIITYFVVGVIIKKLLKNETTGLDLIPQKEFWFALPFLIKDGFLFTFSPIVYLIKRKGGEYETVK